MSTPFKLVHLCIVAEDGPDTLALLWDPPRVLLGEGEVEVEVEGDGEGEGVSSSSKDSS